MGIFLQTTQIAAVTLTSDPYALPEINGTSQYLINVANSHLLCQLSTSA